MNRKYFSVFLILFSICSTVFSQVSVSPDEDFYTDVKSWQLKEYIYQVPQIRPYPLNTVKEILEQVIQCGSELDQQLAQNYYKQYFDRKISFQAAGNYTEVIDSVDGGETNLNSKYSFSLYNSGNFLFNDYAGLAYNAGVNGFNVNDDMDKALPYSQSEPEKTIIRGFSAYNDDFACTFDINAAASAGSSKTYATLGVNRSAFGPYMNSSLQLGRQAYQSLNLTFNHTSKYVEYAQILGAITAKSNSSSEFKMDKYMAFHSLRVPLFSKQLHLSYYEGAVWGQGFMPSYIMPVPYVIMGNVSGFNENITAGLLLEWMPFSGFKVNLDLDLDDLQPKQLIKLNFDSGLRTSFMAGIEYSPEDSICNLITLHYTMATPYTYTYYYTKDLTYNYEDYTNMGTPIGLNLPPNSDRVSLSTSFKPSQRLNIKTTTSFIRHANAYQSLNASEVLELNKKGAKYFSDGSIQTVDYDLDTAVDSTNFMTQENQMYIIQGDLCGNYTFKTGKKSSLVLSIGYTFEFIQNYGIDNNIYSGKETTEQEVKNSETNWKDSLIDKYNHYFSVGLKFTY